MHYSAFHRFEDLWRIPPDMSRENENRLALGWSLDELEAVFSDVLDHPVMRELYAVAREHLAEKEPYDETGH
jgi:hypothetical protein